MIFLGIDSRKLQCKDQHQLMVPCVSTKLTQTYRFNLTINPYCHKEKKLTNVNAQLFTTKVAETR